VGRGDEVGVLKSANGKKSSDVQRTEAERVVVYSVVISRSSLDNIPCRRHQYSTGILYSYYLS
jgi:hypothetical protein